MKVAFALPWNPADDWILPYLPKSVDGILVSLTPPNGKTRLPYLRETIASWQASSDLDSFDIVYAWEMRAIVAVALWRKLHPIKARRFRFVAVAPIIKGNLHRVLPLLGFALRDAEIIYCFTTYETANYPTLLRLTPAKFRFIPSPWDCVQTPISKSELPYLLALGHSARDYPTLLRAVADLPMKTVIIAKSPKDLQRIRPSDNVRVRYNTDSKETDKFIADATVNILPLREIGASAGHSVLLRTMAAGKAIIATETTATRDYIVDRQTALTVPVGDSDVLRAAILRLWDDTGLRAQIGTQAAEVVRARYDLPVFAARLFETM